MSGEYWRVFKRSNVTPAVPIEPGGPVPWLEYDALPSAYSSSAPTTQAIGEAYGVGTYLLVKADGYHTAEERVIVQDTPSYIEYRSEAVEF